MAKRNISTPEARSAAARRLGIDSLQVRRSTHRCVKGAPTGLRFAQPPDIEHLRSAFCPVSRHSELQSIAESGPGKSSEVQIFVGQKTSTDERAIRARRSGCLVEHRICARSFIHDSRREIVGAKV